MNENITDVIKAALLGDYGPTRAPSDLRDGDRVLWGQFPSEYPESASFRLVTKGLGASCTRTDFTYWLVERPVPPLPETAGARIKLADGSRYILTGERPGGDFPLRLWMCYDNGDQGRGGVVPRVGLFITSDEIAQGWELISDGA